MEVIVVVGAAFGLTVSEAKTGIMCLRTEGIPTTILSIEAASEVCDRTNEFVYLGGNVNHEMRTCPLSSTGA